MFLLIDSNNYYSKFWFGNKENVIDIFLSFLKKAVKYFNVNKYCCCVDAPISFRHELYSEYKSNRNTKPQEYYDSLELLKFNFKKLNVHHISSKSLESEDIIHLFVKNHPEEEFIVLSGDKDCLLLYKYINVKVFNYDEGIFTKCTFDKYEVGNADMFKLYLSLRGDSSDNIPGVKGIGENKAKKLAHLFGNCDKLKYNLEKPFFVYKNDKDFQLVLKDKENFLLSEKLITLYDAEWKFNLDKYKI